ncbi:MAG: protein translocase subunit SecD [Candidatus Sumerlaeia bacterium]|nr:protein translocase subunit SecD [Candidatus Sumerlaeia bacterium]
MQRKILWRFLLIVFVVLLAIYYIIPSLRVIHFRLTTQAPADTKSEEYKAYEAKLRQLQHSTLPMGALPIRFGLDLEGGTDVTIRLDEEATIRDRLAELNRSLLAEFRRERVAAKVDVDQPRRALEIALSRPADARVANTIIENYSVYFDGHDPAAFEQGRKVVLTLKPGDVSRTRREAMEAALKVIRRRVDVQGLVQPLVVKQGEDRIRVQMPGVADPDEVIRNIIKPAQLEFRVMRRTSDEDVLKLFEPAQYKELCAYIEKYKKLPDPLPLKKDAEVPVGYVLFPGEYTDRERDRHVTRYKPYLLSEKVEITGARLRNAFANMNPSNVGSPWEINLQFDRQGALEFREITRQHLKEPLAIVLDGFVYSAPIIQSVIPNGAAVITGNFTQEEAINLALVLKAGALPANLKVSDSYVVEATMGADSIRKGIASLLIGALAVVVFLIIYYGTAGFIAVAALLINVLCTAAILCLARATLTLSGIGGLLLTIGMADDANVLIYERIREEKETSRGLKAAVSKGFLRAFAVIFDSNCTALVLLQFGTGSVQGFAVTLTFGIFATLFTGLFVTHVLAETWLHWRGTLNIGTLKLFRNPRINFMGIRFFGYGISGLLLLVGIVGIIARGGLQYGVEFTGGVMADVTFTQTTSEDQIKSALGQYFPTPVVQRVRGENRYIMRVKAGEQDIQEAEALVQKALKERFGEGVANVGSVTSISAEVGRGFIRQAITAVLIGCIGILIYMWFRFELVFGVGAVIALFHDVLITLGLVQLFGQEINLDVVAALLIVVGYSVNDTIVIFDRVRENLRNTYGMAFRDLLNMSINQSLNRTVITVLTTLFTTVVMLMLGGPGLRAFALTLTIGIIKGTYSSSFVASPLVYEYHEWRRRKQQVAGKPKTA